MGENSSIEWCHHTFNPWIGCTKVSPACDGCYAEAWAKRSGLVEWGGPRRRTSAANWRQPLKWHASIPDGERQRIFCASLADVFDNEVPDEWRFDLFELIRKTPRLDWLLLTKRIGNAKRMLQQNAMDGSYNMWVGATVVTREEFDRDIEKLRRTPAHIRFLSMEPLLEPMGDIDLTGVDWVIVGGESGSKARPMHPAWARSLRDQCVSAGVSFFFKQWGEWAPDTGALPDGTDPIFEGKGPCARLTESGWEYSESGFTMPLDDSSEWLYRLGKRLAGRMLDGRTWDEYPEVRR